MARFSPCVVLRCPVGWQSLNRLKPFGAGLAVAEWPTLCLSGLHATAALGMLACWIKARSIWNNVNAAGATPADIMAD